MTGPENGRSRVPVAPPLTVDERGQLEEVLAYHFQEPQSLEQALTHRSHRQSLASVDNERLEFLGDRVLGLVASEHLFQGFPALGCGTAFKGARAPGERVVDSCGRETSESRALSSARPRRGKNRGARKKETPGRCLRSDCRRDLSRRGASRCRRIFFAAR